MLAARPRDGRVRQRSRSRRFCGTAGVLSRELINWFIKHSTSCSVISNWWSEKHKWNVETSVSITFPPLDFSVRMNDASVVFCYLSVTSFVIGRQKVRYCFRLPRDIRLPLTRIACSHKPAPQRKHWTRRLGAKSVARGQILGLIQTWSDVHCWRRPGPVKAEPELPCDVLHVLFIKIIFLPCIKLINIYIKID